MIFEDNLLKVLCDEDFHLPSFYNLLMYLHIIHDSRAIRTARKWIESTPRTLARSQSNLARGMHQALEAARESIIYVRMIYTCTNLLCCLISQNLTEDSSFYGYSV